MSYRFDFQAIKRLASLEQIAYWLGLDIKGGRCMCPVNEGDKRELVLTFDKGLFKCFGCGKKYPTRKNGGDSIALVQHVLDYPESNDGYKDAAAHIEKKFSKEPAAPKGLPANGLDYLERDRAEIRSLKLSQAIAEEIGIGFAERGTMRGHVLFPIRDKAAKLRGYIGWDPKTGAIKLPKDFLE